MKSNQKQVFKTTTENKGKKKRKKFPTSIQSIKYLDFPHLMHLLNTRGMKKRNKKVNQLISDGKETQDYLQLKRHFASLSKIFEEEREFIKFVITISNDYIAKMKEEKKKHQRTSEEFMKFSKERVRKHKKMIKRLRILKRSSISFRNNCHLQELKEKDVTISPPKKRKRWKRVKSTRLPNYKKFVQKKEEDHLFEIKSI